MAITGTGNIESNATSSIASEWALPADRAQVFTVEDKEFRFCVHCHTPKPVAQIVDQGPNVGICVNCVNGRNNYIRLAKRGQLPWPAAVPQPTAPEPKPAPAPKAPAAPPKRVAKGTKSTSTAEILTDAGTAAIAGLLPGGSEVEDKNQQILDLNAKRAAKRK